MADVETCVLSGKNAKTTGEKFEGIAFTFCKAATIILLTQKFALPIASGAAAIFYALAFVSGKQDTRCWLIWPPAIAGFWTVVCVLSTYLIFNPNGIQTAISIFGSLLGTK